MCVTVVTEEIFLRSDCAGFPLIFNEITALTRTTKIKFLNKLDHSHLWV